MLSYTRDFSLPICLFCLVLCFFSKVYYSKSHKPCVDITGGKRNLCYDQCSPGQCVQCSTLRCTASADLSACMSACRASYDVIAAAHEQLDLLPLSQCCACISPDLKNRNHFLHIPTVQENLNKVGARQAHSQGISLAQNPLNVCLSFTVLACGYAPQLLPSAILNGSVRHFWAFRRRNIPKFSRGLCPFPTMGDIPDPMHPPFQDLDPPLENELDSVAQHLPCIYTILYYTILYYTILYYTILYYTILYYTILYYTILY